MNLCLGVETGVEMGVVAAGVAGRDKGSGTRAGDKGRSAKVEVCRACRAASRPLLTLRADFLGGDNNTVLCAMNISFELSG